MRSSAMLLLSSVVAVMLLLVGSGRNDTIVVFDAAVAATPVAPVSPIRAISSQSCSSNGCPTSCDANETLVSAICVGVTGAKFSDTIRVEDGVLTATCASNTNNIVVLCARK